METFKKDWQESSSSQSATADITSTVKELHLLNQAELPTSYVVNGFFVKQDDMTIKIFYNDIVWIEAGGNYSHIHFKDKPHITVVHNLGRLAEILPKKYFTRINKSEIVNLHLVDKFCGNLIYINTHPFVVAANCREYVFSCFNVLIRKR